MLKLNLGCGTFVGKSWLNIDGSFNAWFANHRNIATIFEKMRLLGPQWRKWPKGVMRHNFKKTLPFKSGTVDAVYGSHILEHLNRNDAIGLLHESKRLLKTGGTIRLLVPDLEKMISSYLKDKGFPSSGAGVEITENGIKDYPADKFVRMLGLGQSHPSKGIRGIYSKITDFDRHKWLYDRESLNGMLSDTGFALIEEKRFNSSRIPGIEEIEGPRSEEANFGFCLEAVKP